MLGWRDENRRGGGRQPVDWLSDEDEWMGSIDRLEVEGRECRVRLERRAGELGMGNGGGGGWTEGEMGFELRIARQTEDRMIRRGRREGTGRGGNSS